MDTVASVSASASQSLTLIGGVLAFGPAPAEPTGKPTEEPLPVAA